MNEKTEHYIKRTVKHIRYVQDRMIEVCLNHAYELELFDDEIRELMYKAMLHDASKFSMQQYRPYINFTWSCSGKCELTMAQRYDFETAWQHHYMTENHHPEKNIRLSKLDIIEVACDLQGMSDELCNEALDYFDNAWIAKTRESIKSEDELERVTTLIRKILTLFQEGSK